MTVVHCKKSEFDVYIGRPSKWGNPFSHKSDTLAQFRVKSRAEAIASFEKWVVNQPSLMSDLHELKGKVLGCWCAPLACHGEVLARLALTSPSPITKSVSPRDSAGHNEAKESKRQMGIMDMVKKAQENMSGNNDGEFFAKDQRGQMLIHEFIFYETDKGKWAAINGEIVENSPLVQGAIIQPVGTKAKIVYKCHGDYPLIGYEGVLKALKAIYDPADDAELALSMKTCFGSDESGFTKKATAEDRKHPLFAARGVLVNFKTANAKNSEKRIKAGKHAFVDVALSHVDQEVADIQKRATTLPEVG